MEKLKDFFWFLNYTSGCGKAIGRGSSDFSGSCSLIECYVKKISSSIDGYGYGSGCGNRYTSGDGSGDAIGFSNKNVYNYEYGYDFFFGAGIESINGMKVVNIDGIPTAISIIKGQVAKGYIVFHDFSLEKTFVVKAGNYYGHGETIREARQYALGKMYANMDTDAVIDEFVSMFDKDTEYDVGYFYEWHNRLTQSCKQGLDQFAKQHNINLEYDRMTTEEFIDLTKDSFGGEIIKKVAERYE